jgi:replicative superfamily II helicase
LLWTGGKSLVAEILMLVRLYKTTPTKQRKQQGATTRALLVLPYLSIVSEKAAHLSKLLADLKWRVQGYLGETEGQPLAHKVGTRVLSWQQQHQQQYLQQQC